MEVYLDYNATTPVSVEVQDAICDAMDNAWGNPSSSYKLGKVAKSVLDNARSKVADMIGGSSDEILFTSGGTECNNMVISSAIHFFYNDVQNNISGLELEKPHIITSNVEHDSVKLPLERLLNEDKIELTVVRVSVVTGAINVDDIVAAVRPNTCLITIMLANNETGVIQPISPLRSKLNAIAGNTFRSLSPILLHTDAAQAIGKIKVDVQDLDVDFLTIVGHKFYGPRIGALYYKSGTPLYPIFYGGGQERNLRPGTENICMAAGLGRASELVSFNLTRYRSDMIAMRNYLKSALEKAFGSIVFHFDDSDQLPNTLSVGFNYENVSGPAILAKTKNLFASTGAACHLEAKPSPILIASGISSEMASKTLRLSVGRETTKEEIDMAISYLRRATKMLNAY
ncbi:selenocysteine lyase [Trichonephila clavipes]|uniref:Selenocysteine lyase n=1 Tax=Trichonephila clavipes TaxID=2585209 RepID=A0A8X7BKT5_TRICX|nr:selenocysteine lyase [Trichonephila clavipes]